MTATTLLDIPAKPRVLIADDSRIVRVTLIKHIEGMFDFREALDGEEAWEALLVDPSIRVVITDLTMPKLDGYGLLRRIRDSKVSRIRNIPVVVVSGSDEREERERAKAAGANDLVTKGIATAQLLSRLDVLTRLVATQGDFERGLEALVGNCTGKAPRIFASTAEMRSRSEALFASALKSKRNFVVLNVCIGMFASGSYVAPPGDIVDAVGYLLRRTIRASDQMALTGDSQFTLAAGSINFDSARTFAERVCRAIAGANLGHDSEKRFIASCGLASLNDERFDGETTFQAMTELAHRRALLGLGRSATGVVGRVEEVYLCESRNITGPACNSVDEKQNTPDLGDLAPIDQ